MATPNMRKLQLIVDTLAGAPDMLERVANFVQRSTAASAKLREGYRSAHWGNQGNRGPVNSVVPDTSQGVIVLGALCQISYLTAKGRGRPVEQFEHDFSAPYPWLCFPPGGDGLVIVQGESRYRVTDRGIEG